MRRINIEITIVFILSIVILCNSNASAGFTVNLEQKIVYKHLGVFVLDDIGVGEFAYVSQNWFCIDRKGQMKIPKDLEVVNDRSEFMNYFKVKRLPNNKVSVELIPKKLGSKHKATLSFLKRLVNKRRTLQCDLLYSSFGYSKNELLNVSTVDGTSSLEELLGKIKPLKKKIR